MVKDESTTSVVASLVEGESNLGSDVMCHHCGSLLAKSHNSMEQENANCVLTHEDSAESCKSCGENKDKDRANHESPHAIPPSSPSTSSPSSDSALSNSRESSVNPNFYSRGLKDRRADNSLEDYSSDSEVVPDDSSLSVKENGSHQIINLGNHSIQDMSKIDNSSTGRDAEMKKDTDMKRIISSIDEECETSSLMDEIDAQFWLPPEPDDQEDDVIDSVANYEDDDDECGDGANWSKSSSFSSSGGEGSGSYKFKEEKRKAMDEVMNGKFKALVGQLIRSVGVASVGDDGQNWVNLVTSLSWEAAAFVKPDVNEGKAMDLDGYVKVKCVATGSRNQSRVIKGLVFKKHAAHKHMATTYKNPRLLLIHGSLDLSSSGLSSFQSMKQEKDSLKSITDMIEMYHPNVVLVEKSVSRDIQESILAKGMTLVYDMKIHRLGRIARCIGSPITSDASGPKLRQCDSFHIEKFVEEHAVLAEGGKKLSKTLMFLEGSPACLGCTILLMGATDDELKRIKCVVRCAVVMAYHFMLETSFLLDQRAMFSTIPVSEVVDQALHDKQSSSSGGDSVSVLSQDSAAENNLSPVLNVPINNQLRDTKPDDLISHQEGNSSFPFEPYDQSTFPGVSLSASLNRIMDDSFPLFTDSSPSMSIQVGFDGKTHEKQEKNDVQDAGQAEVIDYSEKKPEVKPEAQNVLDHEQTNVPPSFGRESSDIQNHSDNAEEKMHNKDEISSVFDSESILVLMSSRNALRGTICEQSHFSHIKFYRSFDIPLGKFLQRNLLNQRLQCKTCGEPPEAHFYYYAHHNKQLTIQVRQLPVGKGLPGENKGKLWMWSRCGRCKDHNGSSKSTKRVLISTDACGLSFGKFLELSFSNNSAFNRPSSCGHSFHKDFLYFFGLGSMVAMFKYSRVTTYSVSLPPQKLEFNFSVRGELLKKTFDNVYKKGIAMFLDIEKSLKDVGRRYVGVTLNIHGSCKEFSDIMEMLKQERCLFETAVENAVKEGSGDEAVYKLLSLNRVRFELLLESSVWDHRLYSLLSSDLKMMDNKAIDPNMQEKPLVDEDIAHEESTHDGDVTVQHSDGTIGNSPKVETEVTSVDSTDLLIEEIPIDGQVQDSGHDESSNVGVTKEIGEPAGDFLAGVHPHAHDISNPQDNCDSSGQPPTEKIIPINADTEVAVSGPNHSEKGKRLVSVLSTLDNDRSWIWYPFSEIRQEYIEDLHRGYSPKFESFRGHSAESMAHKLASDEGSRLHIPLGIGEYIVSDYEDEFSSIIACALTLLNEQPVATEDARQDRGLDSKSMESSQSLTRLFSLTSPRWSSFSSFDSDGTRSPPTGSLEESHSSSFDGLDLLDSLVSYGASHPKVSMGLGKLPGKRKYSVICLYANEFRQLRDRCCPSEFDYIASLSRCRNWDAKGGKSKSFFAKTLDDRFIIKEIKRTEFDSFMTFAPNYFEYMNQCYELGNQTCLAKILGLYQVVIRAPKNGKETRHDLLVMENLSFGRNIARQYDLKGALHARFNSAGNGSGDVLLDQNFVNDMNVSPLYVSRKSKRNLQRAVWNDTTFLQSINVMDYSLLVGVDTQRRELVCGIIDYLRQYTWDKQLENWVKSSLVVPKNQLPTIISPKEYKKRFRKFIDTHFLSVPDHWCSQRSSNPCKLCGSGEESGVLQVVRGDHDEDEHLHAKSQEQVKKADDS